MKLKQTLENLPDTKHNVVSVLSGGLDSSSTTILLAEKYGPDRVTAISFDYGQKQKVELHKAAQLAHGAMGIQHRVLDLSVLGEIARPYSANISGSFIKMPKIADVIGDPTPSTYVPNRNMIMYSIAAAVAEVAGAEYIFCGLQSNDDYNYWDTTPKWVEAMNAVLAQNRKIKPKLIAPFNHLTKLDEIRLVDEAGKFELLQYTLTCYDPDEYGRSCGVCPSCAERIKAFAQFGRPDPIEYSIDIDWNKLIEEHRV